MKIVSILIAVFFAFQAQANFEPASETKEIVVTVSDALVPSTVVAGTEKVKAVISGLFPNGCYNYSRAEVDHDAANNIHEVRAMANVSQGMCLMVMVPFTKEIKMGTFSAGEHRVRFLNGDGTYMEKRVIAQ